MNGVRTHQKNGLINGWLGLFHHIRGVWVHLVFLGLFFFYRVGGDFNMFSHAKPNITSWWMNAWFLQDHAASRYIFTCLSKVRVEGDWSVVGVFLQNGERVGQGEKNGEEGFRLVMMMMMIMMMMVVMMMLLIIVLITLTVTTRIILFRMTIPKVQLVLIFVVNNGASNIPRPNFSSHRIIWALI